MFTTESTEDTERMRLAAPGSGSDEASVLSVISLVKGTDDDPPDRISEQYCS
ncbi:MAG: hypothetical protein BWZ02_01336 [Lentisphaerae bacterium ADurb.BinA184]|nr:MAG: hypothetical protein BWZ02_01336 [Lentisphaerae bacterium ADurb.BinA184]